MSCDDIEGTEVLVYVRRATGGGTGGVTYAWDYYQMASLPTNDNVRYRTVKLRTQDSPTSPPRSQNSPTIPLHEIGNNRYEDMVCKSTHLAYKVGAFNRSAVISGGESKNPVDKLKESGTNKCVLLMTSSNNFYQRLPECWPWSCRRWTIDITDIKDDQGKVTDYNYKVFKQDINGYKVEVSNFTVSVNNTDGQIINILNNVSKLPRFALEIQSSAGVGNFYSLTTRSVFKVGINKTESHPESIAMDGSFYEETQVATGTPLEGGGYQLTDDEADVTQCPKSSQKVFLAFELFPVLCDGTCKLIIRLGYKCIDKDNGSSVGRNVQKNISPFWSCRINEMIEMFNENDKDRPLLNLARITLDGTETQSLEVFEEDHNEKLSVITGADYYYDNNDTIRKMYNLADGEVERSYYSWNSGGVFGKAAEYIAAQSTCCKYCKKVDPITKVATYYPNVYCSALDSTCDGRTYGDYKEPCP